MGEGEGEGEGEVGSDDGPGGDEARRRGDGPSASSVVGVVVPRATRLDEESPTSSPEEPAAAATAATPTTMRARTGRANQRYNDANQRLVAGCICYRDVRDVRDADATTTKTEDSGTSPSRDAAAAAAALTRVEVLMLNSRKGARVDGRDLIFPKGGWELDETAAEAAARESMEEGGVAGEVGVECKWYEFVSASRLKAGAEREESKCVARVFTMKVKTEYVSWPEMGVRTRHWLTPEEAWRRCKHDWMRRALVECARLDISKAVVAADSL